MSPSIVRAVRCTVVWLSATAVLLGGASLLASELVRAVAQLRSGGLAEESFDTLLVWLCSCTAACCCVWLWLTTTAVILVVARGLVAGNRLPRLRGCPELLGRALLVACGVAVLGSLAIPANAQAGAGDGGHAAREHSSRSQTLSGLPLPERTIRDAAPAIRMPEVRVVPVVRSVADESRVRVRVRAGDTLWGITAESLGPGATTEAINDRCHELYELNRAVIGADPDLIFPGQYLRIDQPREDRP